MLLSTIFYYLEHYSYIYLNPLTLPIVFAIIVSLLLISNMSDTTLPISSPVNLVGVHLPTFWHNDPAVWFKLAELQFQTRGITQSTTMFSHIVSALPSEIVQEARDVIMSPHATEPYEHLKSTLLKRTTDSEQRRLDSLINGEELGDRKPSQLLRRLQQILDGKSIDDALFRQLFLQRLPSFVRSILASRGNIPINELADLADDIMAIPSHSQISTLTPQPPDAVTHLLVRQIELLNSNIEKLQLAQRSRSPNRSPRPRSPSSSAYRSNQPRHKFCWYHFKFGANAMKCEPPCEFKRQNMQGNQRASQ